VARLCIALPWRRSRCCVTSPLPALGTAVVVPLAAWHADRCLATRNNIRNTLVAYVYSVTGGGGCYLATRNNSFYEAVK
jgi:hypothetical protein